MFPCSVRTVFALVPLRRLGWSEGGCLSGRVAEMMGHFAGHGTIDEASDKLLEQAVWARDAVWGRAAFEEFIE